MPTLRQRLGSMLIVGFDGIRLNSDVQRVLAEEELGGAILFARNWVDKEQVKELCQSIKECSPQPVFIAVDQEGGRVVRFSGDFSAYPSAQHYGQRHDGEGYLAATATTAKSLASVGVNLNLLPICDLQPEDKRHVVYKRSFTSDPEVLSSVVAKQVLSLRENRLFSCAKHFPGLESGVGDPHLSVSRSNRTHDEFRQRDFLPFRSAIRAGVELVMVTHLLVPLVDPENIATFSSKFIERELRRQLGFDGLVISDDLQMVAATESLAPEGAGRRAILGGCDLLIYGNLSGRIDTLIDRICTDAESDSELLDKILESSKRIKTFKDSHLSLF